MEFFGTRSFQVGLAIRVTGDGPVLVLIHGGTGSRSHWSRNVAALSRRFKVMTLDLPGFGESPKVPEGLSTAEYLSWVERSVQLAAGGNGFHLVGFSFGGAVSAAIASSLSKQGHAPERLTLISPSGFGKPVGRTVTLEKVKKNDHATEQEIREATARNLGRWMLSKEPDISDPAIDIHLHNASIASFDSRSISHEKSLIEHLRTLDIPVQILLGERDPLIFPSLAERKALLKQSLPDLTIQIIPGVGHWAQYEASDDVNNKIIQFHFPGDRHEL